METRVVGKISYIKREPPYNWVAIDEIGTVAVGETKKECMKMASFIVSKFGRISKARYDSIQMINKARKLI